VGKGRKSLVADGRLTVPLFHGTSTLFYESIVEAGLGGRNIVEDLGLRAVVRSLLELCESELEPDPKWLLDKAFAIKIAANPTVQNLNGHWGFNFRYGGTYVSASRRTAETYALLYDCGSEALALTLRLLERLSQQRPALAAREEFSRVNVLARKHPEPLLVEARDVEVASLRAEQGGSCAAILERVESALAELDTYDLMVQQENFELLRVVPVASLRFHKIKRRSAYGIGRRLKPHRKRKA
jgi:hypothetical protein